MHAQIFVRSFFLVAARCYYRRAIRIVWNEIKQIVCALPISVHAKQQLTGVEYATRMYSRSVRNESEYTF